MYCQVTPQYITANFQLASSFFNCSVTVVFLTPRDRNLAPVHYAKLFLNSICFQKILYKLCQNHRFCSYKGKYGSEKTHILTYFTQSKRKKSKINLFYPVFQFLTITSIICLGRIIDSRQSLHRNRFLIVKYLIILTTFSKLLALSCWSWFP